MSGFNHVAGGFVFTGLFGSLMLGINILASPITLVITLISSLLPDIDHTRSTVGKVVYPLAKWINRRFGHRTITHGMPCLCVLAVACAAVEKTFFGHLTWTGVFALGYFSHLLLDMFTLQGVTLMYPFSRAPYVMIGNPDKRMRTGDYRKEAIAFSIFLVAGFFMQPLFAKGFWTVWNQGLATLKHVHGEFLRSNDLLKVTYEITEGGNTRHGSAFAIETTSTQAWCIDSAGQWVLLKEPECRRAFPEHTGRTFAFQSQTFISIPADSLNLILQGKTIQKLEVQANQPFQVTELNSFPKSVPSFAADHPSRPPLFAAVAAELSLDTFIADKSFQAEIEFLQSEIRRIETAERSGAAARSAHAARLAELRRQYAATADVSQRQRLHEEIEGEEARKFAETDEARIEELKDQIARIRKEASYKATTERTSINQKNAQELSKIQPTRFTGIVTFLLISGGNAVSAGPAPTPMPAADTIFQPKSNQKTYKVVGVKDGDTVEAFDDSSKTTFVIRLAHVDTPEKSQAFGTKAKQFTSDLVFGKQISIEKTDVDRYGRWVCVVTCEGKILNLELVKAGFAWHYKKYSSAQEYAAAEVEAKSRKVGLWQDASPTPPWDFRKAKK